MQVWVLYKCFCCTNSSKKQYEQNWEQNFTEGGTRQRGMRWELKALGCCSYAERTLGRAVVTEGRLSALGKWASAESRSR